VQGNTTRKAPRIRSIAAPLRPDPEMVDEYLID
jgi:hypothetical protein